MKWSLGFVFGEGLENVLLMRKGRTLHVGLWNGIGGKIEANEKPVDSMARECQEEAGLKIHAPFWEEVGTIGFPNGDRVHVFASWVAELKPQFEQASVLTLADKPAWVTIGHAPKLPLAPHVEILIYSSMLKLREPKREPIHIQEVARF